jgi:hypothetical protein
MIFKIMTRRLAFALAFILVPALASANERHFTYTYETAVLSRGQKEIEIWTTPRIGRDTYFYRLDERVELEVGVTDRWQLALYLNATAQAAEVSPGVIATETEFEGVSLENKIKLMDPVADAVGLGLYAELGIGPTETEIELKLLLDKRLGNLHVAANLVGELELEAEGEMEEMEVELEREMALEIDLGATYFVTPAVGIGAEVRNLNVFAEGELEYSALFAGPVISYATEDWWLAFTVQAQLPSLAGHHSGSRVLDDREKVEARLLWSFHI